MTCYFPLFILFALIVSACGNAPTPVQPPTAAATLASVPPTQPPSAEDTPTPLVVEAASTAEAGPAAPVSAEVQPISPGAITFVALGDSLTQGDGDDSGRGYPGRLLDLILAVRPDSTMTNLGQSGWNSDALITGDQGIASQLDRAVEQISQATANGQPAVALVWIGSNDMWYQYEYNDPDDAMDAADVERYTNNIDTILSRLRGAGASVFIALLDDQSQRPVAIKGEAFPGTSKDELARMSQLVIQYNAAIQAKAVQYGALTVDFYNTTIFTDPVTLYDDGNHPNPNGYDIVAQKWFEAIQRLLQ